MAIASDSFPGFLREEIRKYGGVMIPVRAGLLECLLVKKAAVAKLHPNPDDEFSRPEIGPNYSIISEYMARYQRYGSMKRPEELVEEPLMVEKVHPDGYMLLNGHHRWAAYWKLGVRKAPVSIVNLTQKADIEEMRRSSSHDRRATLDLDEVVFCRGDEPAEKPLPGLWGRRYREKLRLGLPALLHFLTKQGYDIWVYSAKYYSMDYIRAYLRHYSVKVDGIVTGTARKTKEKAEDRKQVEQLFRERYAQTLHIDRDAVLRTFAESRAFEEYPVDDGSAGWAQAVMSIVRGLDAHGTDRS